MFVSDELHDRAERFGDRVAVRVDGVAEMSFAEWDRRANAVARGLSAAGARKGDRVALLMTNDDACALQVAYIAVLRAGAVAVLVNPRYARREIEHVLADSGATAVVTAGDQTSRVHGLNGRPPALAVLPYTDLIGHDDSSFRVDVDGDDPADIFYTSGTTGLPKGVASTHDNAAHHAIRPVAPGGTFLHAMPLSTFTGVIGAQLTPMRLAVTSVLQPTFETGRFAELIERERAMFVLMVPAHILLLLESGALHGRDTSSVVVVMFGGAPTPPAAVEALAAAFPNAVLTQGYGLTEGGNSVCVLPPGEALKRPGSVGRPMPGVEIRIVDELEHEVAIGDVGEITLKLPAGRRSYHNDPDATARTWREGWVFTGDLGRLDEEGYLFIVDRKKDMVLRGGYNIYSVEVESALFEHPDVAEVAIVGVPHAVLGQDVCAVVRLREGARPLTLDDLRTFVVDRLADYKRPRRLVLRAQPLPRTGMGKVDKARLLAELS